MSNSTTGRDAFPFRPKPETMRRIEQWYQADNCRSKNEFIEKAVNYYANALAAKDVDRLPAMVAAALNSRLKTFEDRLSSLLFKQAVELDTLAQLNAAAYQFDEASLRDLRAKSVQTVKATHGRISFEQRAREAEAARYGDTASQYGDDYDWQD